MWGRALNRGEQTLSAGGCCEACMKQRKQQTEPGADPEVPACNVWTWCGDKDKCVGVGWGGGGRGRKLGRERAVPMQASPMEGGQRSDAPGSCLSKCCPRILMLQARPYIERDLMPQAARASAGQEPDAPGA